MSPTASIDRRRLQSYLGDHLTGADAGRARALKMKEWYADDELGPEMARVADEIDEDHAHLDRLIGRLGLRQPLPFRAAARLGEIAGRLKPNGRLLGSTPLTPLLELELLRSAVAGKQGLWETLEANAILLGLDPQEYARLAGRAERQQKALVKLHAGLRESAFTEE